MPLPWTVVGSARGLSALGPCAGPQAHYFRGTPHAQSGPEPAFSAAYALLPPPPPGPAGPPRERTHAAGSGVPSSARAHRGVEDVSAQARAARGSPAWLLVPRVWAAPRRPSATYPSALPNGLRSPTAKKGTSPAASHDPELRASAGDPAGLPLPPPLPLCRARSSCGLGLLRVAPWAWARPSCLRCGETYLA